MYSITNLKNKEIISKLKFDDLWNSILSVHSQSMLIYGMSYSGKTNLLMNLLKIKHYDQFKYIFYITGQVSNDIKKLQKIRSKQIIPIFPINHQALDIIQVIIDSRNKVLSKYLKKNKQLIFDPILIVFDDFVNTSTKSINSSVKKRLKIMFKYLVTASRHINISVIMLSQNIVSDITPDIRSNIDIVIFTMIDDTREDLIWKTYFRFLPRKEFSNLIIQAPKYSKFIKITTTNEAYLITEK